jgi:hypothetical protein
MSFPEWSFIVGSMLAIGLAAGPWMFMVHAKLAVIASQVVELCEKIDRSRDEQRRLWDACNRHASRLDTHEVKLLHIAERMREE